MKNILSRLHVIIAVILILAACAPATPTPTPPTVTPPAPTATSTLVPDANAKLVRGPYLQSVMTDSIIVVWDTDLPSAGQVVYSPTDAYGTVQPDSVIGTHHAITLTGLSPYTTYFYQAQMGDAPLGEGASFRTAAGPDQTSFSFVVYGDTQNRTPEHQSVVDRIVLLKPDFAIHTGDLTDSGWDTALLDTFFQIENKLMASVPVYSSFGNHEKSSQYLFDALILPGNEQWYTFDYGNARFVCLKIDGEAMYRPGSEQYKWLEATLAANTQPWLIVYFHIPPFFIHDTQENLDQLQANLVPLLETYKVNIVFNGHVHNYQRSVINGINYILGGGGGGGPLYALRDGDANRVAAEETLHAVYVTINGKTLTSVAVRPDGSEFDEFTLTLP